MFCHHQNIPKRSEHYSLTIFTSMRLKKFYKDIFINWHLNTFSPSEIEMFVHKTMTDFVHA